MSSKPILTPIGLGFHVHWVEDERFKDVTMKFHNFVEDRGDLRPEVKIEVKGIGNVFDNRINLNSSNIQTQVANQLMKRELGIPWGSLIEMTCSAVRDAKRVGEPIQDLSKLALSEGSKFAIEPFLLQNQSNLFYGNGGLGKSWVSLYFAVLMAAGHTHNGFTPEPGRVLYLDYESDVNDMNARFKAICNGLGIKEPPFDYRHMSLSVPMESERILEIVDEKDISLIIIDSAAPGAGGEPEKAVTALEYFNALNASRTTTLTIGHVAKGEASEKGTGTPFGSIFWRNEPRNLWEITQGNTFTKSVKEFGLFQTKYNAGAGEDPIGLRFIFDDPRNARKVEVERIDISSNIDLAENLSWYEKITNYIREARQSSREQPFEGVSALDIAEYYGEPGKVGTVQKDLSTGKKKGFFINPSRGSWDLASEVKRDQESSAVTDPMNFGSQNQHEYGKY